LNYLIISAATVGSAYVNCLEKQRAYFQDLGLNYMGFVLDDRGSWNENTKLKPEAIRKAFKHCQIVLWVDSDCSVNTPPEVFEGEWDIATTNNIHPLHKCRISAGFILFRKTEKTLKFLELWDELNKKHKKDHPALIQALNHSKSWLNVGDMSAWLKGKHTINKFLRGRGMYEG